MDCSPHTLAQPLLPPGFRFHPTDEELLVHYLKKKTSSCPIPVPIMAEIDLYKFDPWELPSKANFGEREWYFFSPRDRKYPNGTRPNRAAASGYWKATGTDKPILTCDGTQKIGVKKALVFYGGKPPKGIKTNWIMHEYRLTDSSSRPSPFIVRKSLRLDDWVLCRVYMKNNHSPRISGRDQEDSSCVEEVLASLPDIEDPKLNILPRLGSIGGFSSEPDAFFDHFLNDGTTEADTSSLAEEESSLPTRNASNLNFTNPSLIPRNATFVPAGFFPKLESIEMDSSNFDLTSLKRCAPNTFKDEGHHTKRSFMLNNLSQFTQMMLPLQQQQKPHAILGGDMGSTFRFPFSDGRQKN